ncbi:PTS transporter subunit EIIB [Spiroplasma taiwanense]|nr:PTS transporter subunit EIIB [Spiroplasma taiwanense]
MKKFLFLGNQNYKNPYNCMTRFRANIIDKSLVNIDELKKLI